MVAEGKTKSAVHTEEQVMFFYFIVMSVLYRAVYRLRLRRGRGRARRGGAGREARAAVRHPRPHPAGVHHHPAPRPRRAPRQVRSRPARPQPPRQPGSVTRPLQCSATGTACFLHTRDKSIFYSTYIVGITLHCIMHSTLYCAGRARVRRGGARHQLGGCLGPGHGQAGPQPF